MCVRARVFNSGLPVEFYVSKLVCRAESVRTTARVALSKVVGMNGLAAAAETGALDHVSVRSVALRVQEHACITIGTALLV